MYLSIKQTQAEDETIMSPRPELNITVLFTLSEYKRIKILLKCEIITNLWPVRVSEIVTVNLESEYKEKYSSFSPNL